MREPGRRSRSRRLPSLISPFSRAPHPRWLWHRHVRHCARRHPPIEGAMTVKTKKIIMVELVETNVFSRWHCTVCDGCTNPVSVLAEGKDGKRAIRVCEQCLEAAEIDKRLAATAAAHERHAAYLRSLVGRLRVPSRENRSTCPIAASNASIKRGVSQTFTGCREGRPELEIRPHHTMVIRVPWLATQPEPPKVELWGSGPRWLSTSHRGLFTPRREPFTRSSN